MFGWLQIIAYHFTNTIKGINTKYDKIFSEIIAVFTQIMGNTIKRRSEKSRAEKKACGKKANYKKRRTL